MDGLSTPLPGVNPGKWDVFTPGYCTRLGRTGSYTCGRVGLLVRDLTLYTITVRVQWLLIDLTVVTESITVE